MMVKVKICGIKSEAALQAVIDAGADYFGLVHYPRSPRHLDLAAAARLVRYARLHSSLRAVVLLVDPDDRLVAEVQRQVAPDMIQLHGRETRHRVEAVRAASGLDIIKAVGVVTESDVLAACEYWAPGTRADIVLFDAKPPPDPAALPGGNGLAFDWRILRAVRERMPFALAGGLSPDNVGAAIRLTGAEIVDVSSGVERDGAKDPELIACFLRAAKTAKQTA